MNSTDKKAVPFIEKPGDDVIICRCEEITRGEIRRAVYEGMVTYNEVKRYLRAGMGLCQGQSCCKSVRAIIASELGVPVSQVGTISGRAPVRPVTMGELGNYTHELNEKGDENE